jgi:Domain of unknown function (DUF6430)
MAVRERALFLVKETHQNGFVRTALTGLGALGTVLGVAGLISAHFVADIPKYAWAPLLLAVAMGSFLICIPKKHGRYTFESNQWTVEIGVGDLFEQSSGIVVTVDRRLSLDLGQTGPDSLVGQLVARWFGDARDEFLDGLSAMPPGTNEMDLPLGAVIRFSGPEGRYGWLFCLSTKTADGSRTTWQDLARAYDELWAAMRRENSSAIVVPVIGAGFARSQLSFNGLLLFLILSFHAASLERLVTKSLKIIVSQTNFDPRAFSAAGRLLVYLGYDKGRLS